MSKFQSRCLLLAALALPVLGVSGADAALLITSPEGYTGPVLNISTYANGVRTGQGPITFSNGITYSSFSGRPVVGNGNYNIGDNGVINVGKIATNNAADSFTLSFATPVSSFGAFLNYAVDDGVPAGNDPTITALNSSGQVIASFDLFKDAPISTPGGVNAFEFRGILDTTADIAAFKFAGAYLVVDGVPNVSSVPLPASAPMFGAAVLALGLAGYGVRRGKVAAAS